MIILLKTPSQRDTAPTPPQPLHEDEVDVLSVNAVKGSNEDIDGLNEDIDGPNEDVDGQNDAEDDLIEVDADDSEVVVIAGELAA